MEIEKSRQNTINGLMMTVDWLIGVLKYARAICVLNVNFLRKYDIMISGGQNHEP